MLRHLVFIINPRSGVRPQLKVRRAIEQCLDKTQFTFEVVYTSHPNHGIELAAEAASKGAWAVVAVGGDGSVNDVAKGLAGTGTALAILPKGSGNGMARTLGIPLNFREAVEVINRGKLKAMDIAYANDRLFVSNAGVAFDALISRKFSKTENRGFGTYVWLVTKLLWLYKSWEWHICVDGQSSKTTAFLLNVSNGQQFGYNFRLAPMASCFDGQLDLIVIRRFPKFLVGMLALRAMNGTIAGSRYVSHYQGSDITISHPQLRLMQSDGDAHPCSHSIHFRVVPGAQKVIVP